MVNADSIIKTIGSWLNEVLDQEHFLMELNVLRENHANKIQILLDGDNGVSISYCAEISRKLSNKLRETDLFDESFTLEVSSIGLDKPLKTLRQLKKNIGRQVNVSIIGSKELKGTLEKVDEEALVLKIPVKKKEAPAVVKIPQAKIDRVNALVTFLR